MNSVVSHIASSFGGTISKPSCSHSRSTRCMLVHKVGKAGPAGNTELFFPNRIGRRRVVPRCAATSSGESQPEGGSSPVQCCASLIHASLNVPSAEVDALLAQQPDLSTLAAGPEVEANLQQLLAVLSQTEAVKVLGAQPQLLTCPLTAWVQFLSSYGFDGNQIRNLVAHSPDVFVSGTLVTAADALRHLKQLGFDDDQIIHRVVANYPQILMQDTSQIDTLIRLWSKFSAGIDCQDIESMPDCSSRM